MDLDSPQTLPALITAVTAYCCDNYRNGWADLVINYMTCDEIAEVIEREKAYTPSAAIAAVCRRWANYSTK